MSAAACGLTGIEVLDGGLLALSLQLLPSDGFCFLHLELHLTEGERRKRWGEFEEGETKETTAFSETCCGIKIVACSAVREADKSISAMHSFPQHR